MDYQFNKTLPHRSTWILERTLWRQGVEYVVGIDEVGKGAIAGPLVVGAVVLPINCKLKKLNDSKILSPDEREKLSQEILRSCVAHVLVSGSNTEIDQEGIATVNRKLFQHAFEMLAIALEARGASPGFAALDGRPITKLPIDHEYIIDGDARVKTISAASIIAKVFRDSLMNEYAREFQTYGFGEHKGYGTHDHWKALDSASSSSLHRQSFLVKYRTRRNQGNLV